MKTNKTFAYGLFAVILALSLAGCPDPDPTHTHDYGTEWKSNETQHWHECSCGDKTDVDNHTAGDWIVDQAATATIDGSKHKECTVCGYETETETIPATGEGHIHDYGTEWKSNATQHWHECSCGEKTDVADHSGDPCAICGYASGSQNPDICECNGKAEDCDCEDCECETCTVTANVNVAAVPFTDGTELKFKIDGGSGNNYSFVGGIPNGFVVTDLNDITYTLSSVNPVKDLSAYSNGNIPSSVYATNDYPTITQTFYYGGQAVGQRRVVVLLTPSGFQELYEYKPTEFDGEWFDTDFETINTIPATTLNLSKEISANTSLAANAQAAPTHTLASNLTITLNGTGSTGNISVYAWECASYTANQGAVSSAYTTAEVDALIANADTATATVEPRKAGTYVFKLTVTDNDGETDTDTVAVVVGAITHTITVPAITFSQCVSLDFSTVSALSGWNTDFASTDVTYTLTLSQGGVTKTTVTSTTATSISTSDLAEGIYTITQTFYYKGNPIPNGSRSAGIEIDSNYFTDLYVSETDYESGSLVELTLLLSKGEL